MRTSALYNRRLAIEPLVLTTFLQERDAVEAALQVTLSGDGPRVVASEGSGGGRAAVQVTPDGIALVSIAGPLVNKPGQMDALCGGPTSYRALHNELEAAYASPNVRAVLLDIESPGGEAAGANQIASLIQANRRRKPTYAVADGYAYSAAYWIGSAANRLFVDQDGGVGSIGVLMAHVDQSKYNERRGVAVTYLHAGARKIDGNPHEPLSDEARARFTGEIEETYENFVAAVARNRSLSATAVRDTEAATYSAKQALSVGLADEIGGRDQALSALRDRLQGKTTSRAASAAGISRQERRVDIELTADAPQAAADQKPQPDAAALAAAKAEGRTEGYQAGYADAGQVLAACALAGASVTAAAQMVGKQMTPAQANAALLTARAEEQTKTQIASQIAPSTAGAPAKPAQTLAQRMSARYGQKEGK